MNRYAVAAVAGKDLRVLLRKRGVRLSIALFPLVVAVGLALVIHLVQSRNADIPPGVLTGLMDAFTFYFVIVASILPTAIAAYSLVGEKVEHSLEPLLATPTTDAEILLGKAVAAVVPPLLAIWGSAVLFMALCDAQTTGRLGHPYFPNARALLVLLVVAPLAAVLCVEFDVLISARVSDVRAAQQIGGLVVLPFAAVYVMTELGLISLDVATLAVIAAVLAALDLVLSVASRATFRREEILTRWR